jgi:hypothetical protein
MTATAMTAAAMTAAAMTTAAVTAAVTAALGLCGHVSRCHHQARHADGGETIHADESAGCQ